ncbi:S8 family peptidase [Longispora sp. NPDC051575]|uniref:S8 family peptidase n=1 Tax=Longispora sp. NPDC051575 TaxID=3154943 RepID=UPI003441B77C
MALALPLAAFTALALGSPSIALADPVSADKYEPGMYIVQLDAKPLAAYDGSVAGLQATKPAEGQKLDARSAVSDKYRQYLSKKRDAVAQSAGVKQEVTYDTTYNGFAAHLTPAQAAKLESTPGVKNIVKSEIHQVDTFSTPAFLGLSGPAGTWQKQFGGQSHAGEGVIVGVIDSGFSPDNPSFAPLSEPRPDAAQIAAKWKAGSVVGNKDTRDNTDVCEAGTDAPTKAAPVTCNNKVLGARWYRKGLDKWYVGEFDSPRDFTSHGSHTASTAAGNANVAASAPNGYQYGNISGMAPAARLAIYKVCWALDNAGANSCSNIDSVKAIDDAVFDGVDVINYSISGSTTSVVDPVEIAFLNAAQAGVFVAASAGNSGDTVGVSSVAHNSPWLTTVAASTHDRAFKKSVTLGNGATYTGQGLGDAVPLKDLVDSVDVGLAGKPANEVELCFLGSLDPAKVAGKTVLCKRGTNDRTAKSQAVKDAGGVGMVLYNPTPNSLAADLHAVPSVHVNNVEGAAIKAYIAAGNAKASLSAAEQYSARSPEMAAFSSYGPALAGGGSLLKPDITAPGVDIVAAVKSNGTTPQWGSMQGTSMSSPHIAGIAALIKSAHQDWSPMAIKSAIMTTATQKDNSGLPIQNLGKDATPLNFGAGHVQPGKAFDPGLVYESNLENWFSYICALGQRPNPDTMDLNCDDFPKIDASDLNTPSIALGGLAGTQVVTRTVKNITNKTALYTARVEAPAGTTATVSPARLAVAPGKTATYKVTFTWNGAPLGKYTFGALTWNDANGHSVRSPIAVRPLGVVAPQETPVSGTSGSTTFNVKAGFTGTLSTTAVGLVPSTISTLNLKPSTHEFVPATPATNDSVGSIEITVPAGSSLVRFATYDTDYPMGTDIDLHVYRKVGTTLTRVGASSGGTAAETVTLTAAATYVVFIDLFGVPAGTTSVDVKHHNWIVGGSAGNLTVTPTSQAVVLAKSYSMTATWAGLESGKRYLGRLVYSDGTTVAGATIVAVNA